MSPGSHLGQYLGCKDPAHIARWHAAMMAGRRAAPKCDALTREGKPCRRDLLYGADRCSHHLKGRERDAIDAIRLERACKAAAVANNAVDRAEALKAIRNIQRRALHRAWLNHPEIEGSTLELSPHEEERVRMSLRDDLGLDVERPDSVTGRALTPRALDRARWAGYLRLKDRLDPEAARRRVASLLRDERRYWARHPPP
jgi:hypothetical protein